MKHLLPPFSSGLNHRVLLAASALVAPFPFSQCQTIPASHMAAVTGELNTPDHSLPKHEYPFDASGEYREDWVSRTPKRPGE